MVVTVAGFYFLWLQVGTLKSTIQSDTHSKLYSEDSELLKLLYLNPEMRPYIYGNRALPSQSDDEDKADRRRRDKVEALAELYCSHFEHIMLQLDNLPHVVQQSWVDYVRYIYTRSPAIQVCYEEMKKDGVFVPEMHRLLYKDCTAKNSKDSWA